MSDLRELAACRDHDPEIWFPIGTPGAPAYEAEVERAKAICRTCPALISCLFYALDNGVKFGVWGATTEFERDALLRELPRVAA